MSDKSILSIEHAFKEKERNLFTETTSWGTYLVFNSGSFNFNALLTGLKDPKLFLKLFISDDYYYCKDTTDKTTGKSSKSFFDTDLNPYWEEDGVDTFPEKGATSQRPARDGNMYDFYIRFNNQREGNLLKALIPFIDHARLLEIFRFPEEFEWDSEDLRRFVINFSKDDRELEDSEFAFKTINRLSKQKNLNFFLNQNNEACMKLLEPEDEIKNISAPNEKLDDIFIILQSIKSQMDDERPLENKDEIESLVQKNQLLQEELDRLIVENGEIVEQFTQKVIQAQSNSDQFLNLLKAFHPGINFLSNKSFLEILDSKNAEYAKNLIEQLKKIASIKSEEIESLVKKEFSKLPDTESWYFLDTFKTSGYADGMVEDNKTGWKGGVERRKEKQPGAIYLSLSKPHGNLIMFFDFALQRSSAEERLKTLDPPELQKDHF